MRAQLDGAKWNLDKTVVRAPADGYVTNLALRKGARVATAASPVMAFIDTSETIVGVEIPQIDARYIEPGQPVEVTFKFCPGEVYTGKVEAVLQAISTGQVQTVGPCGRRRRRSRPRRSSCASRSTTPSFAQAPAGRQHRRRRDLHRPRQGRARHPQGPAAADRDLNYINPF